MEMLDLYTADRERTGKTMARGGPTPDGLYRLVVHVCIFDEEGRMLIQQRQPFKKGWSNMWDVTVGGCAVAGDSSRTAAERETREELGLSIDLTDERPSLTINWENGFDDYYVLTKLLRMIEDGLFIPYEKTLIELLFRRRENRSSHTRRDGIHG